MKEKMRLIMEISLIIRELSYSRRGYRPESYAAALDNLTIIGDLADILHNIEAATGNPFVQRMVDEKLRKFVTDFPAYKVRLSPFLNGCPHDLSLGAESLGKGESIADALAVPPEEVDIADIEFDRVLIEDDRWTGAYDGGNAQ
ncbi:TPA: MarR family transcriptional regulator [Neisseria gonorrhoeae]|uniref:MarR family transcriptional regulator n=1 Tax=Neisseria gonorrhoeae TaxID=485 RepID=UPI00064CD9DE|nr:MarR family transcriptional regulator [Neisseria gonorrhoeae]KLS12005.1 MarR family transcriptional regulator [Neisseria gonorrhoeae ATL_2011_01_17]MCH8757941.1 MarR family transcriptional regulator [Neisseria gonorrhoeae]MCH8785807.1 MarR family transcriptional regulator [Neisseria gonorrhoeae]MCH8798213.1 MarR family transcriptional regulator [Neisseria gonorrhoeae]ROU23671.1 MarR family transcriptional regulator [Neisseria gonorrhoeae]